MFNNSFKVEGVLHFLNPNLEANQQCRVVEDNVKEPVIAIYRQSDDSEICRPVDKCLGEQLCVGVIEVVDVSPGATDWVAHAFWRNSDQLDDGSFMDRSPKVFVKGDDEGALWLLSHAQSDVDVRVCMESGDPNDAVVLFQSWMWLSFNTSALVHSLCNIVICVFKLLSVALYSQPPNLTLTLLSLLLPVLFCALLRFCLYLNWACFEMRLFPYDFLRISLPCL